MFKKKILAIVGFIAVSFASSLFALTVQVGDDWHDWGWRMKHRHEWRDWRTNHMSEWKSWGEEKDNKDQWKYWCLEYPHDC